MPLTIEAIGGDGGVDDDLLRRVNAFDRKLWSESDPDEPPYPIGITRLKLTEDWRSFEHRRWIATNNDADGSREVVGAARLDVHVGDATDPTGHVTLQVAPRFRTRGIGTALLRTAADELERRGRTIVGLSTDDRVPEGERFAQRRGATPKLVQRQSECPVKQVDTAMVDRWCAPSADVDAEYELWRSTGPYPTEAYAAIARIQNVMNSAPTDDLERRDVQFTADHVADQERQQDWSLGDRWTHFVRHRATGDLAGFTRVYLWHTWTGMAEQGDTAVDPEHRERGLGKWLKGSMVRCLLDDRPDIERIRTTNAYTNGPMLAINEALGFRVTRTLTEWQVPLATLRGNLRT